MTVAMGVCLPTEATDRSAVKRCIEAIEVDGFDHIAAGEHVLSAGPTPNAFTSLSFAAAMTERVRLVSAIALAPLYPAALLAKLSATLDALSGGRFVLGVGIGGENPSEFAACGVPVNERGVRTDEALRVVRALTSGTPASLTSARFELHDATLQPTPLRAVPMWVAGRSQAAIERTARYADAWYPYLVTADQLEDGIARLRVAAQSAGRPAPPAVAYCFVHVAPDGDAARAAAAHFVARRYKLDPQRVARYVIAGTAAECTEQLQRMRDAGAAELTVRLACDLDDFERALRVLATEVSPALR